MTDTRLTEERLKSWLDSNQVQRERLCVNLLPLFDNYSKVEPRRPKGGPDQGRDIQAYYNGNKVFGGVGFKNSANDSSQHKKWAKRKFKEDLKAAKEELKSLDSFVFFTNVDLTPKEIEDLKKYAFSNDILHCEIFYRERLRQILDSIIGYGLRLQYLGIEMSQEEQVSFVEMIGNKNKKELDEIRQRNIQIDSKINRLEFLNEYFKPTIGLRLLIILKEKFTAKDLGHFRVMLQIKKSYEKDPYPILIVGGRDFYIDVNNQENYFIGVETILKSENPITEVLNKKRNSRQNGIDHIAFDYPLVENQAFEKFGDFDRTSFDLFITRDLKDKTKAIGFLVNDFAIINIEGDKIASAEEVGLQENNIPEWLLPLSDIEEQFEVIRVYLRNNQTDNKELSPPNRHNSREIHFNYFTPIKMKLPPPSGGRFKNMFDIMIN